MGSKLVVVRVGQSYRSIVLESDVSESPAAARGQEVRRRLLAAAVELIPERGWTAVSTRVLAERAGVTPSVVHYHFPSLSALLRDAVVVAMREVLAVADPALSSARSPGELVDTLLGSVEQYTGADPLSLLFIEAALAAARDETLRAGMGEVVAGFQQRLTRALDEHGVPAAEATAAVLAAAVDGLLLHRSLAPAPDVEALTVVLHRLVDQDR